MTKIRICNNFLLFPKGEHNDFNGKDKSIEKSEFLKCERLIISSVAMKNNQPRKTIHTFVHEFRSNKMPDKT